MSKIRVGIIRGGMGPLYAESIKTGKIILDSLDADNHVPVDIFIDREGVWHTKGIPRTPLFISQSVDVILNALHGKDATNGYLNNLFSNFGIPVVGADILGGSITSNKKILKERLSSVGIKTPKHIFISHGELSGMSGFENDFEYKIAESVFKKMPPPWIIKPVSCGYALHTYIASTFRELVSTLSYFKNLDIDLIIEEYVKGDTVTFGGIRGFRGKEKYDLLPLFIKRNKGAWHHDNWHKDHYDQVYPKSINKDIKKEIDNIQNFIWEDILPGDYFSVNAKITKNGVFVLGIQAQPKIDENSPFFAKLKSVGVGMKEFIKHLINHKIGDRVDTRY